MTNERRERWGEGPWLDEPDYVEWRLLGLPCLIVRHPEIGTLCGYVAVPPGHPLHGSTMGSVELDDLAVHGGITYAGPCNGHVCHVPFEGEPEDVLWLGFDAGHGGDYMPACAQVGGIYRTLSYMIEQTNQLAQQLSRMSHG